MSNELNSPVSVVGLGLMGQALAGAFLRAGHPTTVWNRTPAKANDLVAEGAQLAPSPAAALAASPLTVVCVTDHEAVRELLDRCDGDLGTEVLVNLTSGSSAQGQDTAGLVQERGAAYLDGAIMAVPADIGTSAATILLSGPKPDPATHLGTLEALGSISYLGEDYRLSALYDVAGLGVMWGVLNSWLSGAALLKAAGIDAADFTPLAQHVAVMTAQWLPGYAEQVDSGEFPADDATVQTHAGGLVHLVEESNALGVNAQLPELLSALADRAIEAGYGSSSYAALIHEFSQKA